MRILSKTYSEIDAAPSKGGCMKDDRSYIQIMEEEFAPWAEVIAGNDNGYIAFESTSDYYAWQLNQK